MKNKTGLVETLDRVDMEGREGGFTLIELMLVLVVVGILLLVGIPLLQNLMQGNQLVGQATKVTAALTFARSEASSRSRPVVICASNNGSSCSTSDNWTGGWIIYTQLDADVAISDDEMIKKEIGVFGNVTLNANVDRIVFEYSGETTLTAPAVFHLCAENALDANVNDSRRSRLINVSLSGITNVRNEGATCT